MNKQKSDFTLVCGVDRKHLKQLGMVSKTWFKHKPMLLDRPMLVFFDRTQIGFDDVREEVEHPNLSLVSWPWDGVSYQGNKENKWYHPQRYKMLAGFVHVPGYHVTTPYWLKLDTDVVATSKNSWIDPAWINGKLSICSHRWGYTKPANQMLLLDDWVEAHKNKLELIASQPPLKMSPAPGSDLLRHKRIISWCAFFNTSFTRFAAEMAASTCGPGQLPVPSQDGFHWYVATRCKFLIETHNMKNRGWQHWNTEGNIRKSVKESMQK